MIQWIQKFLAGKDVENIRQVSLLFLLLPRSRALRISGADRKMPQKTIIHVH